jgi:hypothetical protein
MSGCAKFGANSAARTFPIETCKAEKMYIGGGIVGTVVLVLVVLFLVGRI